MSQPECDLHNGKISGMEKDLSATMKLVKKTDDNVSKIKTALLGDEYHPEGLIHRVDKLEKFKNSTKKTIWYSSGFTAGIILIWKLWDKILLIWK